MDHLKIGIIEDDLLIAESITLTVQQIGYIATQPVRNCADAIKMIKADSPDLLLIDIVLDGDLDGIDLAAIVNKEYGIPFIFLTANSDRGTVERAKEVKPHAFLVKPFNEQDLFSSIEIAFSNYNDARKAEKENDNAVSYLKDVIFIKESQLFHKVEINEILYIESDNVYLNIHTAKRQYVVRTKLDSFINGFTKGVFFRVHRSYAVNLKHLDTINSITVKVAGKDIPTHKIYRDELLLAINSIK